MTIALISVYTDDSNMKVYYYTFLYALLSQREAYQNISHKSLPKWEDHVSFVNSKPYKDWFIIYDTQTKDRVGSIYLSKDNEIGIFLSKGHRKKGYGRRALQALMEYYTDTKELKANIAPMNSGSICFFVNLGFNWYETMYDDKEQIIQYTYKMINPYYVAPVQEEVEA